MRVISIDPGYERLGIAVIEKNKGEKETLLYSDCFKTSSKIKHSERLCLIGQEISKVIHEYAPQVLCIEDLFFTNNQKTALLVSESRGVILYEGSKNNLKIFEYKPNQIKVAVTGYGKSDKKGVIDMVQRLIKIDKKISHDDEYDAIAIGLTCFAIEKF